MEAAAVGSGYLALAQMDQVAALAQALLPMAASESAALAGLMAITPLAVGCTEEAEAGPVSSKQVLPKVLQVLGQVASALSVSSGVLAEAIRQTPQTSN